MKRAAIGLRMHSGWGALVAVSQNAGAVGILERRRIARHRNENFPVPSSRIISLSVSIFPKQKSFSPIVCCLRQLALAAIRESAESLQARHCFLAGAAVVLASGRALPPLPKILASHALIHAAEGEFFREAVWKACQSLDVRSPDFANAILDDCMAVAFGKAASEMSRQVSTLGRSIGPPWTTDQKTAAIAALLTLAKKQRGIAPFCREPNFQYLHPPLLK